MQRIPAEHPTRSNQQGHSSCSITMAPPGRLVGAPPSSIQQDQSSEAAVSAISQLHLLSVLLALPLSLSDRALHPTESVQRGHCTHNVTMALAVCLLAHAIRPPPPPPPPKVTPQAITSAVKPNVPSQAITSTVKPRTPPQAASFILGARGD